MTIAGGAGDNAASAIGMGVTGAGSGFLSLGTSGVLFAGNDRFAPNPDAAVHAFCHCVEGRWHQMSVILSAAASLDWLARATTAGVLAARAQRAPLFLPYLGGERTPHTTTHAACSSGCPTSTPRTARLCGDGRRRVRDGRRLDALRAAGTTLDAVSFIGGGSKSAFWARLCANATRLAMQRHADGAVGAALGAARLAQPPTDDTLAEVCVAPPVTETVAPDAAMVDLLAVRLAQYRRLYHALRDEFAAAD